jgi:hypothetical protein
MKSMFTTAALLGALFVPAAIAATHTPTLPKTPPSNPGKPSVSQPRCARGAAHAKQVTYVLRGALSAYTAATATTTGSVTIAVTGGNCFVRALAGTTVTFTLDHSTRVVHGDSISDGDRGTIQLRGPKTVDTTTVAAVTPRLVIDQAGTQQSG